MKSYCILCGNELSDDGFLAKDYLSNVPGEFRYCRCSTCHSYIQTPIPTQEFLTACYESQSLSYQKPQKPQKEEKIFFSKPFIKVIRHNYKKKERKHPILPLITLVPSTPPPAKLLEIGSGFGQYLDERKRQGYSVTGIELHQESCRYAKELFGITLINDLVENQNFPENSFDIVVAGMVLEHLRDPRQVLERLHFWLKKDGELLISLPSPTGFAFDRFGKFCYVVQPPYHIFLSTLRGIQLMTEGLFEIMDYQYQIAENDICRSAVFAQSVEPSFFNRFFAFTDRFPLFRQFVRYWLYQTVQKGNETSRISIRLKCVK